MVSLHKFLVLLVFWMACLISVTQGSCWRYGHSCWGGHGKRSGPPPSTPLQPLRGPSKIFASFGLDSVFLDPNENENGVGDVSNSPADEYQTSDENSASEQGIVLFSGEKNGNANNSPNSVYDVPAETENDATSLMSDLSQLEPNYVPREFEMTEEKPAENNEKMGIGGQVNSPRRHSLFYKLGLIRKQK